MKDLKKIRGAVSAMDAALRTRARELQPAPDPGPFPTPIPPKDKTDPVPDTGEQVDVSPPLLDHFSGVTTQTGQHRDRVARVLAQMPSIAVALGGGEITDHHVDELAKILFTANDQTWAGIVDADHELADVASRMPPVVFARHLAAVLQHIAAEQNSEITRDLEAEISGSIWIDKATGLGRLSATFDPRSFAQVDSIIRSLTAKLMRNNLKMKKKEATGRAILQLITNPDTPASNTPGSDGAHITVLIDERTLFAGGHSGTICELTNGTQFPVGLAQQLACTATLTPVLHDAFGVVLDVGRQHRYATAAQRMALESMYSTCFHTDCDVSITDCHAHHITYWDNGGRTDMGNLLPVCRTIIVGSTRIAPPSPLTTNAPSRL
jgi:hypothetical protein